MNTWPEHMTIAPIREWPGILTPADARRAAPFRAPLTSTLKTLDREISHLADTAVEVRSAELLVDIPAGGFRKDGRPRADARAGHPGVVFSMDTRHGHLSYPADRYTEWEDNLRAIALALEALRKIDRYGVTAHGEQYRGFLALTSGAGDDVDAAIRTLATVLGSTTEEVGGDPKRAVRYAKRAAHPDTGGASEQWDDVARAEGVLGRAGLL